MLGQLRALWSVPVARRLALAITAAVTMSASSTVILGVVTAMEHPAGAVTTTPPGGCSTSHNYVSSPGTFNGPTLWVAGNCDDNFYSGIPTTAATFRGWWYSNSNGWTEGTRGWVHNPVGHTRILVTACNCYEHLQGDQDDWIYSYY